MKSQTPTATTKQAQVRDSRFELLRIFAMLMIDNIKEQAEESKREDTRR